MEFNFIIGPGSAFLVLGALVISSAACGRGATSGMDAEDGGDAQRLVAVLDYVGADYGLAVRGGRVVSGAEYDEQLLFLDDARRMAERLVGPDAPPDTLLEDIGAIEALVRSCQDAEKVRRSCRAVSDHVLVRFGLSTMPRGRPSLPRAEALYSEACTSCHGARGDARTERALELDPPPASFRDPERLGDLSPYRVYNALTFGVPGTAMASFDSLAPADRWSLAFYVFRLGHRGRGPGAAAAMTLADLAARSDREVLAALAAEGHPSPASGLGYLRREAAFLEAPTGVGIEATRRRVRGALDALAAGRATEAERLVLDAYLEGFEPLEPRLHARRPEVTREVEQSFRDLRAAMSRGEADRARAEGCRLDGLLGRLGGGRTRLPSVSAFVIYFREGIEAALVVGALLAGLRRLGRHDAARWVHLGWLLALPAGVATWWLLDRILAVSASHRELMEAGVALTAAAVLFSVSFWMISKADSRRWMAYLKTGLNVGLDRGNLALLSGVAFLAVYREAAETVLFTHALILDAPGGAGPVWAGAAAGLASVGAVGALVSRTVRRLPIGPFFAVSGVLLCGLAVSFAGSGMYELVAGGYLPPRPVPFPEVSWMGIHPDLTALLVQLAIVGIVAAAGISALRRRGPAAGLRREP